MLVLGVNEGDRIEIKLEDGRVLNVYVKLRRVGKGEVPPRFGVAIDAPRSIRVDRMKEAIVDDQSN